jgi:hypothetical protein
MSDYSASTDIDQPTPRFRGPEKAIQLSCGDTQKRQSRCYANITLNTAEVEQEKEHAAYVCDVDYETTQQSGAEIDG